MDNLVTERLVLHPMSVAEAEQTVTAAATVEPDADVRWEQGYPTEGDVTVARRFLERCASTGDPQSFGPYVIRRRSDHRAIGGMGFHLPPDEHGSVTIGYGLVPAARGKGYASEALRALLSLARDQGVTSVKGDADHANTASQHVMTAAGMRQTGEDERVKYYAISWRP
ncbi:Protein N-acetyltransferase, RimJ/RimL family [Streptomyces sp. Ncost-T6T-1]|uniref:GNAT family N-acetyltransferase n=1 Tax=Streptomyces sp. Ncost-T6T-1 TaxID=1100828 RepID=UPI000805C155|nr:GNAT family N-acetyltransferase [Streptomyces sp. Ncost-T6T-1]SBU91799.1 Protein N-acetyltransferase, RimJ/RimL family [Streptomyces sp. Ncost-T6T-1]